MLFNLVFIFLIIYNNLNLFLGNKNYYEYAQEQLIISSLKNGDVLTFFNFSINANLINDNKSFIYIPWLYQKLFDEHDIINLELSFTQGFWRCNIWGINLLVNVPSGTLLLVQFGKKSTKSIDTRWSNLLHHLNGIFCTSIINMNPTFTSKLKITLKNQKQNNYWRIGVLSTEAVCSENLNSWKKSLLCKKSGFVSLLEPKNLLSADFHSISLIFKKTLINNNCKWNLNLLSNTVYSEKFFDKKYWSLQNLFNQKIISKCNIFSSSLFVEKTFFWNFSKKIEKKFNGNNYYYYNFSMWNPINESFLKTFVLKKPLIKENKILNYSSYFINFQTFFKSTNQAFGKITSLITNQNKIVIETIYTHIIPWQFRIYLHTLNLKCKKNVSLRSFYIKPTKKTFTLAKDTKRPLLIELKLKIPSQSTCKLVFEYETTFLKIADYPADANNGFYVPGPILTITKSQRLNNFLLDQDIRLNGEPILILLPVPDFSMPFNVICLVCTSIAIFYGNIITMSTKLIKPVSNQISEVSEPNNRSQSLKILIKIKSSILFWFFKLKKLFLKFNYTRLICYI